MSLLRVSRFRDLQATDKLGSTIHYITLVTSLLLFKLVFSYVSTLYNIYIYRERESSLSHCFYPTYDWELAFHIYIESESSLSQTCQRSTLFLTHFIITH